jgi:NAD(P)-dependent dehydrogenase (short-subunit alcohol dehydrogenase family)
MVVGASRGLGLALVRLALPQARQVTTTVRTRSAQMDALVRHEANNLRVLEADVCSEASLEAASKQLDGAPPLDVLIYNAAIHLEHDCRDIETAVTEDMLATLDVNAVGAARSVKHFRRHLRPGGLLALISSEAGSIGDAGRQSEYGYCMSKAALNMLAKLLSTRELRRDSGVRVLAIHPGWVRTDMGGKNADLSPEESATDLLRTLNARLQGDGPLYVDRFGKALNF